MVNPSSIRSLRKPVEAFRSFFVSVGKSKSTITHITLYSLRRVENIHNTLFIINDYL